MEVPSVMVDKIDKYLRRFCDNYDVSVKSNYYHFKNGTIRVSDHIGRNSTAIISIIKAKNDDYVLHRHSTGEIYTITYNDLKKFVKTFACYGSLFNNNDVEYNLNSIKNELHNAKKKNEQYEKEINKHKGDVALINAHKLYKRLTKEQKNAICASLGVSDIFDVDSTVFVSVMGGNMVQKFSKNVNKN